MTTSLKLRRGTTTQHATFTGAEGEVTVDTTKDTVVVHDGATAGGFPLAKESFTQTGTGTALRTVDTKLKDTVSVKDFGAVGDGVADDTTAFALAASHSASSKATIFVPSGTYLVGYIACPSYSSFQGAGSHRTKLKLKASVNRAILGGPSSDYLRISDIEFDMNPTQNPGPPSAGESLSGIEIRSYAEIKRCRFTGMASAGVFGYGSYNEISECEFTAGAYSVVNGSAVYITSATGASYNKIYRNKVSDISYGLCINNTGTTGVGNVFAQNYVTGLTPPQLSFAQSAAINAWRCKETVISENIALSCGGPGVRLIDFSENSLVVGNLVRGCGSSGTAGIDIGDSNGYLDKNLVISNNVVIGTGGPGFWLTSVYNSVISNNISDNNGIIVVPPAGWVTDFYKAGFVLASEGDLAATPVANNVFSGNSCNNNSYAISRSGTTSGVIVNNTHIGNQYTNNNASSFNYSTNTDNFVGNTVSGSLPYIYEVKRNFGSGDNAFFSKVTNSSTSKTASWGFDNNFAGEPGVVLQSSHSIGFGIGSNTDISGNRKFRINTDGSVEVLTAGSGVIVKSPNGSVRRRIGIDNSGNITATAV